MSDYEPPTPEQEAADEMLRQAITNHALAYGIAEPGEMVSEFAVVAAWLRMEAAEDGETRYTTQFHRSVVPTHVAAGLFRTGEELVFFTDNLGRDEG